MEPGVVLVARTGIDHSTERFLLKQREVTMISSDLLLKAQCSVSTAHEETPKIIAKTITWYWIPSQ